MNKKLETKTLVLMGLFAAIEIILALTPLGFIPLGFTRATTIHIPVILGSIILGPKAGAILGTIFGVTSLLMNTFAPTPTSFVFTPFYSGGNMWSIVIAIVPRVLIGVTTYYSYKFFIKVLSKKYISYALAGIIGSLTNTVLVMGGIYIFFGNQYAYVKQMPFSEIFTFIIGIVGINGVPEAIASAVITSTICIPLTRFIPKNNSTVDEQ